jgi:arylsulfatase A-like enzyme
LLSAAAPAFAAGRRPPNIVFVLADDLGWAELGCYGNTFNQTPNLDRLASQGVRFRNAYSAAPVCSPTRASIMTGQCPARVGINDYLRADDPKFLSPSIPTLPKMLAAAGYETAIIGKWHLATKRRSSASGT